jgi:hypothetical protein
MTQKTFITAVAAILLFSGFFTIVNAVDTHPIEAVRAKKVLDNSDLQAIDNFVAMAIGEILNTTDFSSISGIRSIILANSASNEPGQVQFAQQFSESAKKHASDALKTAEGLTPPRRSFKVITNLFMVLDGLADLRLVDLPLKYVDYNNAVVCYWAVHCVTNPKIVEKLNSLKEPDTARQIVSRLEGIVATSGPETLGLITKFAGSIKTADSGDLLLKVADRRIASYADWSVEDELLDASVLQALADNMASSGAGKAEAGRRFGQLFSYVFQRYMKGDDRLSPLQKEQLVSVLVETEKSGLAKLTGKSSSNIQKAIESADPNSLLKEYNNLFGDAAKPGLLVTELNIDYGKAADGSPLKAPLPLAGPPKS